MGKRLVLATVRQSKVKSHFQGAAGMVEIKSALFNQLRDPSTVPMRGFYAAALQRLFAHCDVNADVGVTSERSGCWSLAVIVHGSRPFASVGAE